MGVMDATGDLKALDYFAISPMYAAGFSEFMSRLSEKIKGILALKGQVTGPFTLGTNLLDRELLLRRALITPSCGAGGVLTEALAERVLRLLRRLSMELRNRLENSTTPIFVTI